MATYTPKDLDFAETAPIRFESVGLVEGSPQEIWAVIVDYPQWTAWWDAITECRATSDPATGLGSTRLVKLRGGGGTFEERFIGWDEPELWAFTATSGPPVVAGLVERLTVREVSPGRCQVTYRMAIEPKRGLAPLVKLARRPVEKNLAAALAALDGMVAARRPS